MRADQLLVQRGLAASRSQAARLLEAGARWQQRGTWKALHKSDEVPDDAQIELLDAAEARYVSRGGLKLEGALRTTNVQVRGRVCLDVGQSTGGFTDCLLQHGAQRVVGVDVGQGQLHDKLRSHPQVLCLEKINARHMNASVLIANYQEQVRISGQNHAEFWRLDDGFDVAVGDLSFISQTLVLPAIVGLLKPGADVLMLVKPQFELQPEHIGKGGIVKDPAYYAVVERRIRQACADLQLAICHWLPSPIEGGDGNHEFFVHAVKAHAL